MLTEDGIKTRLAGPELAAVQTAALAIGQEDPVVEIIAAVTAEVRGYVAAHGSNRLDADTTRIPANLESAALALAVYRLCSRLPAKALLTEARSRDKDDALTLLKAVARGEFVVDAPEAAAPADAMQGGGGVSWSAGSRRASRDSLSGL